MHILFTTSYYPSRNQPITGIFFHDQAMALHRAGHQVGVITAPRLNITLDTIREQGLLSLRTCSRDRYFEEFPVYRMHWGWFPRVLPPVVAAVVASAGFRAFERYCQAHGRPDVIHGHNTFYGGYLAARLKEKFGIPAVLTEYSSSFVEGLVFLPGQAAIIRRTLRTVDDRRACGSKLAAIVRSYAPEMDIPVLGCIVDTEYFSPDGPAPALDPFIFVVIAQLKERRKGFDILLKAFYKAFKGKNVHLYIRGHGPLKPELERLVNQLGLESQVKFLGFMSREELRDLVRKSHALVSSSLVETFAVSVAEAIACGRPVVATISGGPEDYVTERSGILVPPGDVDALAEGMQQLVENYNHYQPNEVRADCTSRYSETIYVKALEKIYEGSQSEEPQLNGGCLHDDDRYPDGQE